MANEQELLRKRDERVRGHLEQYAPVWLTAEKVLHADEAVLFNVVFQHNLYGWVNRRYRYDGFNDVLYHKGQTLVQDEAYIENLLQQPPYIDTTVADIPHAYGG
jgi:hypothetical protein